MWATCDEIGFENRAPLQLHNTGLNW